MSLIRKLAIVIGLYFLAIGALSYNATLVQDGRLFNLYMVDGLHNNINIFVGFLALLSAFETYYTRIFFQSMGVFYAGMTILSIFVYLNVLYFHINMEETPFTYFFVNQNVHNIIIHFAYALIAFYLGFSVRLVEIEE